MAKQLLHLVFGGELISLDKNQFRDLSKVDLVGIFPNFAKAKEAWKAKAQSTVDNALMRYYVVHLHRLLDPDEGRAESIARNLAKEAGTGTKKRASSAAKNGAKGRKGK